MLKKEVGFYLCTQEDSNWAASMLGVVIALLQIDLALEVVSHVAKSGLWDQNADHGGTIA